MVERKAKSNVRVFVSYRRDDVPDATDRLADALRQRFGPDNVFLDVDSVELGADFADVIEDWVAQCDVFLAVIGRGWLDAQNPDGGRRIDDSEDYVRLEIEAALKRKLRVVPVLIHGAPVPAPKHLPPSVAPLMRRNAAELTRTYWDLGVGDLVAKLESFATPEAEPKQAPTKARSRRASSGSRPAPEPASKPTSKTRTQSRAQPKAARRPRVAKTQETSGPRRAAATTASMNAILLAEALGPQERVIDTHNTSGDTLLAVTDSGILLPKPEIAQVTRIPYGGIENVELEVTHSLLTLATLRITWVAQVDSFFEPGFSELRYSEEHVFASEEEARKFDRLIRDQMTRVANRHGTS